MSAGLTSCDEGLRALQLVLDTEPVLYCDRSSQGFIMIKFGDDARRYRLQHPRVKAWVALHVWQAAKIKIQRPDVAWILTVLEGLAAQQPEREMEGSDAWQCARVEPLIDALAELLRSTGHGKLTCLAHELYAKLNKLADQIDINCWQQSWPKSAARLGSELRRLTCVLRGAGIHITFDRTNRGSVVSLGLSNDDIQLAPSPQPSPPNPNADTDLNKGGDGVDIIRTPKAKSVIDQIEHVLGPSIRESNSKQEETNAIAVDRPLGPMPLG